MKKKKKKVKKQVAKRAIKGQVVDVQQSTDPYVEIKSADFDPKKGMKIELDWNDAFIDYLRKNGYVGTSEEALVQKWLGQLYGELIQDVNPSKTSEYE